MSYGAAAKRYAKALFGLADAGGVLEQVRTDLHDFSKLLQEQRLLRTIFYSPEVSQSLQTEVLDDLLTGKTPDVLIQFLKLLVQKSRQSLFDGVVQEFDELLRRKNGQVIVTVKTAAALDEAQKAGLVDSLNHVFQAQVLLHHTIDARLLGGMVIEAEGKRIDLSLRGKLTELKKRLDPSTLGA